MKICLKCDQQYDDDNLNFCLSCGELLVEKQKDPGSAEADATPTVFLDQPRVTNQNLGSETPQDPFGNNPTMAQPPQQDQAIFQQEFNSPQQYAVRAAQDKTLPIVSLVTGILGLLLFCCYLGFPLGAAAMITGYIGMNNANSNPTQYGGKELAIIGMVLGGIAFFVNLIFVFLAIIGSAF